MAELVEGVTFAGCRLEAVAGRGGMGVVWKATQLALSRRVALKVIPGELATNAEFRERFQRESLLTASIEHPNVIPLHEAGELEGTLYLIMRWVEGTDLRQLLKRTGRLEVSHALRLLLPVASALSAAHRRKLIHRDIKPANVLISSDDEHVYLADFGIARFTDSEAGTKTGTLVGTLDYTAPERFEGGHGDVSSDIYAYGCMLYETVTGKVPFDRPTDVSKMFAHINDPVPSAAEWAPEVPASVDQIIETAMAKRPEDRFDTASEMVDAMSDALADVEPSRRRSVPGTRPRTDPTGADEPTEPGARRSGTPTAARGREAATEPVAPTATAAGAAATLTPPATGHRRRYAVLAAVGLVIIAAGVIAAIAATAGGGGQVGSRSLAAGSEVTSLTGGLSVGTTVALPGVASSATSSPFGGPAVSIASPGRIVILRRGVLPAQAFPAPGHPRAVVVGPFGAWVSCSGTAPLLHTGFVAEPLGRAATTHCPLAIAASLMQGWVWAAFSDGRLIRYSERGAEQATTKLAQAVPSPSSLSLGEGWLWVAARNLVRVDAATGASRSFDVGVGAISVAVDHGVWIGYANGSLTRFDPNQLRVGVDITLGPSLKQVAGNEGDPYVWAIGGKSLYRISVSTSFQEVHVTGTATFRSAPVALTVWHGSAWVATSDRKFVQVKP